MITTGNNSFYGSTPFQAYFKKSEQSLILKANLPHFTILAVSDSYLEQTHTQRSKLLNNGLFEVFPGSQADPNEQFSVFSSFRRVIQTKAPDKLPVFKYEIPVGELGNKETFYWSNVNEPIMDDEGNVAYIINTTANITQQVLQEQELEKAEKDKQALYREQAMNEELAALNEELRATNEELFKTQLRLQTLNEKLEEQVARRTKALSDSEARLRGILEQAPLGFCILEGPDLVITYANDRMLKIWNETRDIIGMVHAHTRTGPSDAAFLKILNEVYKTGIPFTGNEVEAFTDEGNQHVWGYFSFVYQPIKNEENRITGILVIVNDVTETVLARKEATRVNEQLRLAVEAANLGSWNIHPQTKALEYSPALACIFGYEGAEPMTYADAIEQVMPEYRKKLVAAIEEAIVNGGDYDFTYQQRRFSDDQLIWLRSLGRISPDKTGDYTLFSGVVIDITDQKREEQRKNDFISMVSHELKTPLTSLGGYTQILQGKAQKNNDSFTAGMLDKSYGQVKRMTSLINGFLNLSRLESGKIQINKTAFLLDDLIQEMIDDTAVTQPRHALAFHPCGPLTIVADRDKISSVVANLLSNAIKFSPVGDRVVSIDCKEMNGIVQVSVTDQGIGISPEDQPKIFERYYRVNSDTSISGFGIGLYLCAEIIQLHGGKIRVESELGKGSTFWFSLPLE